VALSGGALAAALSQGAAFARPSGALVVATAKAAVWVAAGHLAAVATPVAVLTKGVLRAMFLTKLKVVVGIVLMAAALGAGGVAYRSADAQTVRPPTRDAGKPQSDAEALRKEVELLRLNLLVVLEKVRAQEEELRALRGQVKPGVMKREFDRFEELKPLLVRSRLRLGDLLTVPERDSLPDKPDTDFRRPDLGKQAEAALKALREAKDDNARRRALESLDRALRRLREQMRPAPDNNRLDLDRGRDDDFDTKPRPR
jgi:hypothetical protein